MSDRYHEVFMPLVDVYELGGPLVFNSLSRHQGPEKNAILLSSEMAESLEHPSRPDISGVGGKDALRVVKKKPHERGGDDVTIYNMGEGLDVLVCHGDSNPESLRSLSGRFSERFTVITRDSYQHLRFDHFGVKVEEPRFLLASSDIVEEGIIEGNNDLLAALYEGQRSVDLESAAEFLGREDLYMNQFVRFRTPNGNVFARVTGDVVRARDLSQIVDFEDPRLVLLDEAEYGRKLRVGKHVRDNVLGIKPLDMEQYLAAQYGILNPDAETVFITGSAGSGKTLLGYVLSVDQILHYDKEVAKLRGLGIPSTPSFRYRNIVLLKPTDVMGGKTRDVGFLPGTLWDKLSPVLEPFRCAHRESTLDDAVEFHGMFLDSRRANQYGDKRDSPRIEKVAYLPQKEPIELYTSGYLRGVSFRDTVVLIDEAQNFTPYEMRSILSRGGVGTKFVIMGDPAQFDNPACSPDLNGLTSAIQFLLPKHNTTLVKLPRSYRSQTAQDVLGMPVYSK